MEKTIQKFKRGDVVHIAADLGPSMSHFQKDRDAVIVGSYHDKYGGGDTKRYTLMWPDTGGECSWYHEHQLSFLSHGGEELITQIEEERDKIEETESDLNWIIDNWKKIRPSEATMIKLMSLIGITKPFGKYGEYSDFNNHARYTIECLDTVLLTGDVKEVERFITDFPKVNGFIFSSDLYNGKNEFRKPEYIPVKND